MGDRREIRFGELQLRIMRVLWAREEATVAAVRDALAPERELAHSTVATVLSRLEEQGVVAHREEGRRYVYRPLVTETGARRSMVRELVDRLFRGEPGALVNHLLRESEIDPADLDEIQAWLEREEAEP